MRHLDNLDVPKAHISGRAQEPYAMLGDGDVKPGGQAQLSASDPQGGQRRGGRCMGAMGKGGSIALPKTTVANAVRSAWA